MSKCFLIDDSTRHQETTPMENLIVCDIFGSWNKSKEEIMKDRYLLDILPWLEKVAKVEDVREPIKQARILTGDEGKDSYDPKYDFSKL